jgi:hypothetical protein
MWEGWYREVDISSGNGIGSRHRWFSVYKCSRPRGLLYRGLWVKVGSKNLI